MIEPLLSPWTGGLCVLGYAGLMIALALLWGRRSGDDKDSFLLASRGVGVGSGALSIAATWIWAPALFLSAQKAYTEGVAGLFWFTAPNVLCLILFAWFARRARRLAPRGFTLSAFMRDRHGAAVHGAYVVELVGLSTCSFGVQLLAGGGVIAALTGLPYLGVTAAMALAALAYSVVSGLRASVITDVAQMLLILTVSAGVVPWAVSRAGGLDAVIAGLGGVTGQYGSPFSSASAPLALSFGLPVTIGLLSGPFGDQAFWQRAFAMRESAVAPAFVWGALLFAVVPLTLSLLGFSAAGMGLIVEDPSRVNVAVVAELLPRWALVPFVIMLLSGLSSTLDSCLCAVSSIAGHDPARAPRSHGWRRRALVAMTVLAAGAWGLAAVPGLTVLHLFLFYGILRASTLLPTVLTLLGIGLPSRWVFWGIVGSMGVGLPVFAHGNLSGSTTGIVAGALAGMLPAGLVPLLARSLDRRTGGPRA
ncbi:MAG: hypothetical protein GF320_01330 [Armatimonadia bacterium]|nr:hypothetical protein [Armatimonadia bacterium]